MPRRYWSLDDMVYVLADALGSCRSRRHLEVPNYLYRKGDLEPSGFEVTTDTGQRFRVWISVREMATAGLTILRPDDVELPFPSQES